MSSVTPNQPRSRTGWSASAPQGMAEILGALPAVGYLKR